MSYSDYRQKSDFHPNCAPPSIRKIANLMGKPESFGRYRISTEGAWVYECLWSTVNYQPSMIQVKENGSTGNTLLRLSYYYAPSFARLIKPLEKIGISFDGYKVVYGGVMYLHSHQVNETVHCIPLTPATSNIIEWLHAQPTPHQEA